MNLLENNSSSLPIRNKPWQYDWKRPRWECSVADGPNNNQSSSTVSRTKEERIILHVAAQVSADEVRDAIVVKIAGEEDEQDTSDDESSLILTATLLSSSSIETAGDVILLELIERQQQPNDADERDETNAPQFVPVCQTKRRLQWPSSMTLDASSSSISPVQLVSVCLFRQAAICDNEPSQRAHELVHLLSLGRSDEGDKTRREWQMQRRTESMTANEQSTAENSEPGVANIDNDNDIPARLLLACLTTAGQVHIYDTCDLLVGKTPAGATKQSTTTIQTDAVDPFSNGMESFLLGPSVVKRIKEQLLPLCQPLHSVSLSLAWRQGTKKGRTQRKQDTLSATAEEEGDELDDDDDDELINQNDKVVGKTFNSTSVSVWDHSLWDSTTDLPSLVFETNKNQPTHCVAAFDYIVVAGAGRKRHRTRRQLLQPPSNSSDGENAAAKTHPSMSRAASVVSDSGTSVASGTTFESVAARSRLSKRRDNGGFVTFVSLRTYSQERTVYLPFVPRDVSPFYWGGLEFLLVLGYAACEALAIRIDASDDEFANIIPGEPPAMNAAPELSGESEDAADEVARKRSISIGKFQMIPIRLPDVQELTTLVVGASFPWTVPPALAMVFIDDHEGHISIVQRTLQAIEYVPSDDLTINDFYRLDHDEKRNLRPAITTELRDANFAQLTLPVGVAADASSTWCSLGQGWCILVISSLRYFVCWEGATALHGAHVCEIGNGEPLDLKSSWSPVLPLRLLEKRPKPRKTITPPVILTWSDEQVDGVTTDASPGFTVEDAIFRLSNSNLQDLLTSTSRNLKDDSAGVVTLTPRQKSRRLLREFKIRSRQEANDKLEFESQHPVVSVQLGARSSTKGWAVVTMRKAAMQNGAATSFQQILSWLMNNGNYFSAASVALDMLQDAESLRLLWNSYNKIDDDDERATLEGLLDGIQLIDSATSVPIAEQDKLVLQHLSDMTVSLLIHGGIVCSRTLEQFLSTNEHYDSSSACMMLAAASAFMVYKDESNDNLWPLRCLLRTAVTRNFLPTALLLLNAVIPDELRNRSRDDTVGGESLSMEYCLSLVKLIVSSSSDAADLLFKLIDDVSGVLYWDSLDNKTRLAFSVLEVDGRHVMLGQLEVRSWVVQQLSEILEINGDMEHDKHSVPTEWIWKLARACMANAGCDAQVLLPAMYESLMNGNYDELTRHGRIINDVRLALNPAAEQVGIDFDVLLPSLLVLNTKNDPVAGVPLQIQCTLVNNLQAGANLLGGNEGLTLECCDILMSECGMSMDEAEDFLLTDQIQILSTMSPQTFVLGESLLHLLWLLEQHVLHVRTYGEFHDASRGRVDPVFAAKLFMRSFWCITRQDLVQATPWLVDWLKKQLQMEGNKPSPHRLACAALIQVLLWPSTRDNLENENALALLLNLPPSFIILLTQSCCGLYESLPAYEVDANRVELPTSGQSLEASAATVDPHPFNMNYDRSFDDSFASAVSSIEGDEW
ncbi:hypothetical protein MPSEU_000967800 [Mayamaea pseudoterrestris]|nr:hypothetical protein MPSEU_000967800 [Mayamaea pseudoterrestris]